jgi:hypothetical protein
MRSLLKKRIFRSIIDIPIHIALCTMIKNILSHSGTFQPHCIQKRWYKAIDLALYHQSIDLLFRPDDDRCDWSKSTALSHLFCMFTVLCVIAVKV